MRDKNWKRQPSSIRTYLAFSIIILDDYLSPSLGLKTSDPLGRRESNLPNGENIKTMGKHEGRILDYCRKNKTQMKILAKISGVSYIQIKRLNSNPNYNVSMDIVNKIYLATEEAFTTPLRPSDYLDFKCLV